jgi:hypothetical protein
VTFGRRLWVPSESRAVSIDWLPPYARWLSDLRGDAASADSQEREFISVLLAAQLGIRHPHVVVMRTIIGHSLTPLNF